MSDIHIMGLPLSITNRIRCKGAPSSTRMLFSSRGFPEQGMGFFHRIPTFKERIEFTSIASPSPNENGFAHKGSTSPSEWDSHRDGHPLFSENPFSGATLLMGSPFIKGFASLSSDYWPQKQREEFFAYPSGQPNEGHQCRRGRLLPLRITIA